MRTAAIVAVYVALAVIIGLLVFTVAHWRRFRHETDRLRAWQSVYGRTGGKVALVVAGVALAVLAGAMAAVANLPPG